MLSATQTPPSLRWQAYVCTYITMKNPLLFADSYTFNINSDTRNRVIINNLAAPASATLRSPVNIGLLLLLDLSEYKKNRLAKFCFLPTDLYKSYK